MTLFTELLDEVLEHEPSLSLECFLSARRYIQTQWRTLHGTPMPEDALTLFLADPFRGDLTEEQKSFARSGYEAVSGCYRRAAWDLLLYDRMLQEGVVHDLREFRSLRRRRYAAGDGETRCEALCAPDQDAPIPAPEAGHEGVWRGCGGRGTAFRPPPLPPRIPPCLGPFRPADFGKQDKGAYT